MNKHIYIYIYIYIYVNNYIVPVSTLSAGPTATKLTSFPIEDGVSERYIYNYICICNMCVYIYIYISINK